MSQIENILNNRPELKAKLITIAWISDPALPAFAERISQVEAALKSPRFTIVYSTNVEYLKSYISYNYRVLEEPGQAMQFGQVNIPEKNPSAGILAALSDIMFHPVTMSLKISIDDINPDKITAISSIAKTLVKRELLYDNVGVTWEQLTINNDIIDKKYRIVPTSDKPIETLFQFTFYAGYPDPVKNGKLIYEPQKIISNFLFHRVLEPFYGFAVISDDPLASLAVGRYGELYNDVGDIWEFDGLWLTKVKPVGEAPVQTLDDAFLDSTSLALMKQAGQAGFDRTEIIKESETDFFTKRNLSWLINKLLTEGYISLSFPIEEELRYLLAMELAYLWNAVFIEGPVTGTNRYLFIQTKTRYWIPTDLWYSKSLDMILQGNLPICIITGFWQKMERPEAGHTQENKAKIMYLAVQAYLGLISENPILGPWISGISILPNLAIQAHFSCYDDLKIFKRYLLAVAPKKLDSLAGFSAYLVSYLPNYVAGEGSSLLDKSIVESSPTAITEWLAVFRSYILNFDSKLTPLGLVVPNESEPRPEIATDIFVVIDTQVVDEFVYPTIDMLKTAKNKLLQKIKTTTGCDTIFSFNLGQQGCIQINQKTSPGWNNIENRRVWLTRTESARINYWVAGLYGYFSPWSVPTGSIDPLPGVLKTPPLLPKISPKSSPGSGNGSIIIEQFPLSNPVVPDTGPGYLMVNVNFDPDDFLIHNSTNIINLFDINLLNPSQIKPTLTEAVTHLWNCGMLLSPWCRIVLFKTSKMSHFVTYLPTFSSGSRDPTFGDHVVAELDSLFHAECQAD